MNTPSFGNLHPPLHITPAITLHRPYSTSASPLLPTSTSPELSQSAPTTTTTTSSSSSSSKDPLTSLPHLTAASTVHVIPISHKTPTARSALAIGHVTFSNANPLPLIRAHALQKGDVLAVARVAAITAAKKTSDWIPLCHSGVPIEGIRVRVEVVDGDEDGRSDEKIVTTSPTITSSPPPPSHATRPIRTIPTTSISSTSTPSSSNQTPTSPTSQASDNDPNPNPNPNDEQTEVQVLNEYLQTLFRTPLPPHGGVRISVQVDTTAKTGVEMEAMVGVVGAGLAVVDMCKVVDRGLMLEGVRTVWKRGGKKKMGLDERERKGVKRREMGKGC